MAVVFSGASWISTVATVDPERTENTRMPETGTKRAEDSSDNSIAEKRDRSLETIEKSKASTSCNTSGATVPVLLLLDSPVLLLLLDSPVLLLLLDAPVLLLLLDAAELLLLLDAPVLLLLGGHASVLH